MQPPDGFRHQTPITIRFADMDAMGHVNNAVYLTYLEQARLNYYDEVLGKTESRRRNPGTILARLSIDYKLSLVMGDETLVFTRASRLGTKSITMEQQIYRGDGQVAALAEVTAVVFDYIREQSVTMPDDWRQRFVAYEPALNHPNP